VFLASSWYSTEDAAADKKRGWFVAHARGASFRSLNLPIVMTRKMEHIFLASLIIWQSNTQSVERSCSPWAHLPNSSRRYYPPDWRQT
jgi:hypothetical protein